MAESGKRLQRVPGTRVEPAPNSEYAPNNTRLPYIVSAWYQDLPSLHVRSTVCCKAIALYTGKVRLKCAFVHAVRDLMPLSCAKLAWYLYLCTSSLVARKKRKRKRTRSRRHKKRANPDVIAPVHDVSEDSGPQVWLLCVSLVVEQIQQTRRPLCQS